MLDRLRRQLSFANVVSTLALFVALGGSSYAVVRINGSAIEDHSISERKLKRDSLGGRAIKESRLGRVRRAWRAERLGGLAAGQLRLRCPAETFPLAGVCIEHGKRGPVAYGGARVECAGAGRRLPTYEELAAMLSRPEVPLPVEEELTSDVYVAADGTLRIVTVTSKAGQAGAVPDTYAGGRRFRCVAYPRN
jgi:hypothetical protein